MKFVIGTAVLITSVMMILLGPENVLAWSRSIGHDLNPQAMRVYGGTANNPVVLPHLQIGDNQTFDINGYVLAYVPAYARMCATSDNAHAVMANTQRVVFAPNAGPGTVAQVSIEIRPASPVPCP